MSIRLVLPYLWPSDHRLKARIFFVFLFMGFFLALELLTPYFFKAAMDAFSHKEQAAVWLVVAFSLSWIGSTFFKALHEILFYPIVRSTARSLMEQALEKLHAYSVRFHLERHTGALIRTIERIAQATYDTMYLVFLYFIPLTLHLLFVPYILFCLFPWFYGAIIIATLVCYISVTLVGMKHQDLLIKTANQQEGIANTILVDSLLNFETVKLFSNEKWELLRYRNALKLWETKIVRSDIFIDLVKMAQHGIIGVAQLCLLVLATREVLEGSMTIGDFSMVNGYLMQLHVPLEWMGYVLKDIRRAMTNLETLSETLKPNPEITDGEKELHLTKGKIVFKNVIFSYYPERPLLKGLSLTISAGQTIAIVGSSGAGKSTVSKLLLRFFDPLSGKILIDDQDIKTVSQSSLRAGIGIVPQDTMLFNESIFYNIAYARSDATQEDVIEAAKAAHIHALIEKLPEGYDTMVGERGLKLSGGERQRIAIARTVLKHPKIFIFDEATSALDTKTERDIQKNLRDISQGMTTLIIAHRLSTITHADKIVVMEEGRIAEEGTHQQLLDQQGLYASLWQRQHSRKMNG